MTQTPTGPKIGDKVPDGTIYAGVSPDIGAPMYMAPLDNSLMAAWKSTMKLNANAAYGHNDWRPASKNELAALFNNRTALGGDGAVVDPRVRVHTGGSRISIYGFLNRLSYASEYGGVWPAKPPKF